MRPWNRARNPSAQTTAVLIRGMYFDDEALATEGKFIPFLNIRNADRVPVDARSVRAVQVVDPDAVAAALDPGVASRYVWRIEDDIVLRGPAHAGRARWHDVRPALVDTVDGPQRC